MGERGGEAHLAGRQQLMMCPQVSLEHRQKLLRLAKYASSHH